ncbi:hypothetical protein AB0C60_18960, partial [Streptomyces sp. NPDC048845]
GSLPYEDEKFSYVVATRLPAAEPGGAAEPGRLEGEAKGKAKGEAKGRAEGLAKGLAKGLAEGLAEGRAEAVLRVLEQRRVTVPESVRTRVNSCTDPDALSRMLDRSFTVATADELFEDRDRH